jgi:DnaJ-class molecular chaperone
MTARDHYAELDVHRDATLEQITAAYRRLAMARHPDRPEGSAEAFHALQAAYEVLRDPGTRRDYDRALSAPGEPQERQISMTYEQALRARSRGELVRNVLTPQGWVSPL